MSDDKALPEFLKENADGSIDITLTRSMDIDGLKVETLRMREPTVNDQLVMDASKGSDVEKEISMFANLCQIAKEDIKKLTLKNYQRVQKAFSSFIN